MTAVVLWGSDTALFDVLLVTFVVAFLASMHVRSTKRAKRS